MNPYDEYALEQALLLKECVGGEVLAVSMGNEHAEKCIRQALSIGADSGVLVWSEYPGLLESCRTARLLAAVIRELIPDVLFTGKLSVSEDSSQLPERIAVLLDFQHVSAITSFSLVGQIARVDCQVEGGQLKIETRLPAMFTTERGLNEPRYPKLSDILRAKRKKILEIHEDEVVSHDCDPRQGIDIESMMIQRQKRAAKMMDGEPCRQAGTVIQLLRNDGVV
jgi:electron transfer flavoprotein beta subunit